LLRKVQRKSESKFANNAFDLYPRVNRVALLQSISLLIK